MAKIYLVNGRAYEAELLLGFPLQEGVEEIDVLEAHPAVLYQIDYPGTHAFTTEPTEVWKTTKLHPEAAVRVIPVIH